MQKVLNVEVASYPDVMNTGCNVMAVICQDEAGMLAVYVGVVKLIKYDPGHPEHYQQSKEEAAQLVALRGQKQTKEQAQKYFLFPKERYRQ